MRIRKPKLMMFDNKLVFNGKVFFYDRLADAMKACSCIQDENDPVKLYDQLKKTYKFYRKAGVFGFSKCIIGEDDSKEIHLWIGKKTSMSSAMNLIAHEVGHHQRPFHRALKDEEHKAEMYGNVAHTACDIFLKYLVDKLTKEKELQKCPSDA